MTSSPDDEVLERARVREVTGVFKSKAALDDTAEDLLLAGFDRADIDRIGSLDEMYRRLGKVYVAPEELADVRRAPRQPVFKWDDIDVTTVCFVGILTFAAAAAAAFGVVVSNGSDIAAITAGIMAGAFTGAIALVFVPRLLRREEVEGIDGVLEARGLILWVRARSPEQEAQAQTILQVHGAKAVHVHEIDIEKRADDLPLASLSPDPWLGSPPLGHIEEPHPRRGRANA
jgi:hypothetical protein